jgi:hypothetical protein
VFVVPGVGESATDVYYEIRITATDSFGLSTTASANVLPELSTLSLATDPPGLTLTVDGTPVTTPKDIFGVIGFQHEVDAPVQQSGGVYYEFDHWSSGGSQKQKASIPQVPKTMTAFFRAQQPFAAEYFSNKFLQGDPILTRADQNINFTWNQFSPDPSIPVDNFSARWTKQQFFPFGRYKFTTATDDGVRLFIDGQLVIDKWIDQGETAYSATLDISEGFHEIKMEYYEAGGGAIARLSWALTPDQPTPPPVFSGYKGEYYSSIDLSGPPTLVRDDSTVHFDWGQGSPDPSIPPDRFSVRWTKKTTLTSGLYRFTTATDDGVRLYVDGENILNSWVNQAVTTYVTEKYVQAGEHEIKMEYYERAGGAIANLSYQKVADTAPPPPPPTEGYTAKYWNTGSGSEPAIPTTVPDLVVTEPEIAHSWEYTSPGPGIHSDHFVVQWTKSQSFEEGNYYFSTLSDDGMRVFIDDLPLIDAWNDHGLTMSSKNMRMSAGVHEVRVEYYENGGGATAQFRFIKKEVPNAFAAEYFNNSSLTGTPVLTNTSAALNYIWGLGSPDPIVSVDHFSARFTKQQSYPPGTHTFTVQSDDGVRLYLNDQLIIDQWNDHALTTSSVSVDLVGGVYSLRIEYYENTGEAGLSFEEN